MVFPVSGKRVVKWKCQWLPRQVISLRAEGSGVRNEEESMKCITAAPSDGIDGQEESLECFHLIG